MKVGDLVKAGPSHGDLTVVGCAHYLEVVKDFGEAIQARCLNDDAEHRAHKKYFVLVMTLERRLEENNLRPVLGKARMETKAVRP